MQNRCGALPFKLLAVAISSSFALTLFAQTFDDPEIEIDGGLESEIEVTETVLDAELDETLEEYLEEDPPTEAGEEQLGEDLLSEESNFDTFIPSEDISEDFSVPFPVDI